MKNILVIISFTLLCCGNAFSQATISGVFYDSFGNRIELTDDKFVFCSDSDKTYGPNIYAEVKYVWVNDCFIELLQEAPQEVVNRNLEIVQSYDSSIVAGIRVEFCLPNASPRLLDNTLNDFGVLYLTEDGLLYDAFEDDEYIDADIDIDIDIDEYVSYVPSEARMIRIGFAPLKIVPVSPDKYNGYYNSYAGYISGWISIDNGVNNVEVTSRHLDDGYFGRYYVNGDYVRIDGDKLYWRGRVFEKRYRPEDIR